jgi:hypothetical protein
LESLQDSSVLPLAPESPEEGEDRKEGRRGEGREGGERRGKERRGEERGGRRENEQRDWLLGRPDGIWSRCRTRRFSRWLRNLLRGGEGTKRLAVGVTAGLIGSSVGSGIS